VAGFGGWAEGWPGAVVTSGPGVTVAGFGPSIGSNPAGAMAGFGGSAEGWLGAVVSSGPGGTMAGFAPSSGSDPAGAMAGFGSSTSRANRRYRATVSRSIPSSRAIRRWDQPARLNVLIVCF